jgi:hypothetical protein
MREKLVVRKVEGVQNDWDHQESVPLNVALALLAVALQNDL